MKMNQFKCFTKNRYGSSFDLSKLPGAYCSIFDAESVFADSFFGWLARTLNIPKLSFTTYTSIQPVRSGIDRAKKVWT